MKQMFYEQSFKFTLRFKEYLKSFSPASAQKYWDDYLLSDSYKGYKELENERIYDEIRRLWYNDERWQDVYDMFNSSQIFGFLANEHSNEYFYDQPFAN